MKIRAMWVKKLVLGTVLVLVAALITLLIKDLLAIRQPENSLPGMTVMYSDTQLPTKHVERESYSWRFFTGPVAGSISQEQLMQVEFAPVWIDELMVLNFSYAPKDVVMSVAVGEGPFTEDDFVYAIEISGDTPSPPEMGTYELYNNNAFFTPVIPGKYVVRIWADWGWRGSVLYYIKLDVRGGTV